MYKYIISCCSPVDLDRKTLEEKDIKYVYFHFSLGNDTYDDDFGETVPPADMYRRMLAGEVSRTSQVSVGEYTEFFEPFLAEGKDIVHISLSAGISGTYNSAVIAAKDLQAKYPEQKIYVVNSLQASAGYGMFVLKAAELRDAGLEADELAFWLEKHKKEEGRRKLVFLCRPYLFHPGRTHLEGCGTDRIGSWHLPAHAGRQGRQAGGHGEGPHEKAGHPPGGGEDGRAGSRGPGLQRAGLYQQFRVPVGCGGRGGPHRRAVPRDEGEDSYFLHRQHHRGPHRAGNGGHLLLGKAR